MGDPKHDWNIKKTRAREAMRLMPRTGRLVDWGEVEVAQIDTGINRHPTFGPWTDGASPFVRMGTDQNLVEEGTQPIDPLDYKGNPGHGIRTASVLNGRPIAGAGFAGGVAPGLPLVPYRAVTSVIPFSRKEQARLARAIERAVDHDCGVISMSMGSPLVTLPRPSRLGAAIDRAYEAGIIVVAAGGQKTDMVTYPGKFTRTIGVGGTRPDDKVFHKYSLRTAQWIDVWAPAAKIFRASSRLDDGAIVEARYKFARGTSYAATHVAAAAAMWLAYHGDSLHSAYPEAWQRVEAFRWLVGETGSPVKGSYWPTKPIGILNIERLLKAELPAAGTLVWEQRRAALEWM